MNKPTLHPMMESETSIPVNSPPGNAMQASLGVIDHVDYNHRPLKLGPLEHLDPQNDSVRFVVR